MGLTLVSASGLELRHYPMALTMAAVPKLVPEPVVTVLEVSMILAQFFVPLVVTHLHLQ
ncbi:hypothetical protein A2U01_0063304, partial [Trifolium medium]|nr:hypothetical protein [Trifolium medium]